MNLAVALVLVALAADAWARALAGPRALGWRAAAGMAGLASCGLALAGPLDQLAGRWFFVHMMQHLVLLEAAPLLIVAGQGWRWWPRLHPLVRRASRLALRSAVRQRRKRWATPAASALFSAEVWVWHLPYLYDLTLRDHAVHDLEHVTFLGAGLSFFATMLTRDRASPHRCSSRLLALTSAIASMLSLGVLLVTARRPWYLPYTELRRGPGSFSAMTDQRWGGDIMIFAGMVPLLVTFDVLLYRCLPARREAGLPPRT